MLTCLFSIRELRVNGNYTDFEVFAGPEEIKYCLHKAIVCPQSDYLTAVVKESCVEGQTCQVNLPEISPATFDQLVKWLYCSGLPDLFVNGVQEESIQRSIYYLYTGSYYLGVTDIQKEILKQLAEYTQSVVAGMDEWTTEEDFKPSVGALQFINRLSKTCRSSDCELLKTAARSLMPVFSFLRQSKLESSRRSTWLFPEMKMIMLECAMDIVGTHLCYQHVLSPEAELGACRVCKRRYTLKMHQEMLEDGRIKAIDVAKGDGAADGSAG